MIIALPLWLFLAMMAIGLLGLCLKALVRCVAVVHSLLGDEPVISVILITAILAVFWFFGCKIGLIVTVIIGIVSVAIE